MKKLNVLVIIASVFVWLTLMSNSGGRAAVQGNGATNAPGDNGSCGNNSCHSGNTFDPSVSMTLKDGNGLEVDKYSPGEKYSIEVSVSVASGTPSAYGFQLLALDEDGESLDDWSNLSANVQEVLLGNRKYIEHNMPSSSNTFSMDWTPGTDKTSDVQFYFAANAVNGNGSSSGDGSALGQMTVTRLASSNNNIAADINFEISPNPASDFVTIETDRPFVSGDILNVEGKVMLSVDRKMINISILPRGMYLVKLQLEDGSQAVKKMIKN